MLKKIISGGQTGADQAGLFAGKFLGLDTGGTAPHGWITEMGESEELLRHFNLVEGDVDPSVFKKRTLANILNSDATVVFGNIYSTGSKLTLKYCKDSNKPLITNPSPEELSNFCRMYNVEVLNVAGNRESKNSGIGELTYNTLVEAFRVGNVPTLHYRLK
jgi:hypothetical protein